MADDAPGPAEATRGGNVDHLRRRFAELEAREAEHERSERIQAALFGIAEAAGGAQDLHDERVRRTSG